MAQSPTHKFGQPIGNVLEAAIEPCLQQFANEHNLYLDRKGPRPARPGSNVSWKDLNGNIHDLDFVLEKGGTADRIGTPVAFIESAWRRYTKHSRNKAQEIQGAIEPLAETYRNARPFKGVVLAGVFTNDALSQLRSLGFSVLYFPYASVISAFQLVGIDVSYDEATPDAVMQQKIQQWEALPFEKRALVPPAILKTDPTGVNEFIKAMAAAATRQVAAIIVIPLHGPVLTLNTVREAIEFVEGYSEVQCQKPFVRYEIEVRYNNGDQIRGSFTGKDGAIEFLRTYEAASSDVPVTAHCLDSGPEQTAFELGL